MKKRLPIGLSNFKRIIEEDCAYADKTLLIEELIMEPAAVVLIPRPRRFGKTLNLSMLQHFFEKREEDTSYLFKGLKIWEKEKARALQGQFPVIFLSLKDVKGLSWEAMFSALRICIGKEFRRHRYLLESSALDPEEKEIFHKILRLECDASLLADSLSLLSKGLYHHHRKQVVLLIDEYDAPAHAAFLEGYYPELISFLRDWLSAGLKDNDFLEKGVLTGILRIAKESIFSGLNNIKTFTLTHDTFGDKFGLLDSEVKELLKDYGLSEKLASVKQWYDGYRIGNHSEIYNPWSVINCIADQGKLSPYWVNTSHNGLMKELIAQGTGNFKADLELLLKGEVIEKQIDEGIVFPELKQNPDAIWALLLFSGYLTLDEPPDSQSTLRLRIPNLEVGELYNSTVLSWFKRSLQETEYQELLKSLTTGDVETFSLIFRQFMLSSVSVFDVPAEESEKIYHGFVLGMLIGLRDRYEVKSNRESGLGRYDVMLIPKDPKELGILMEFKKVGQLEKMTLEDAADSALAQIENKLYEQEFDDRGIDKRLLLAFAFLGKNVLIKSKRKG